MGTQPTLRVVFVCTGNTCRSTMSAHAFDAQPAAAGLADHLAAFARGTDAATDGTRADQRAREALGSIGLDDGGHRARQLRATDMPEQACSSPWSGTIPQT
ncbi:low molecular weight phosphatase family protein [Aeromicrobium piscarium]|uniref:protein-tyrosine-phosphatase n=1 Tax=Aeromicrobium piscarium TaxID=2590901 RepID=A0A554SCY7_9ACTN|nr:hypothetical protein FNM00_06490 [Aeromicrobium piscarium]